MATSGTYTLSVTRDDIIREAMLNIGEIGDLENPTASESVDCALKLSMMVKQWQHKLDFAPGLKVWKQRRADLFLSASTNTYSVGPSGDHWTETSYTTTLTAASATNDTTLTVASISNANASDYIGMELDNGTLQWTTINGAPSGSTITITTGVTSAASSGNRVFFYTTKAQRPLHIIAATLRDTDNNDVPVEVLRDVLDYEHLPSKGNTSETGDPTAIYYESLLTNGKIYTNVGGASDVTKKLRVLYAETIQDITASADNPEFPQQWYMALCWGLSKQIAPMFEAEWLPEMEQNLQEALAMARQADPEVSTLHWSKD